MGSAVETFAWNVEDFDRETEKSFLMHGRGMVMRKNEMTWIAMLAEAVGIVSALLYLGLQIYYGFAYGVNFLNVAMNVAAMILVYTGLTLLQVYPERVNGLTREVCSGTVRKYTVRMVRLAKLIFVVSLLFTSICDVLGEQINTGYSLVVVALIVITALYYEYKIIRIIRNQKK